MYVYVDYTSTQDNPTTLHRDSTTSAWCISTCLLYQLHAQVTLQEPGHLHLILLRCKCTCGINKSAPRFQQPNRLRGRKGVGQIWSD